MIHVVRLVKLSDDGARGIDNFAGTVAKVRETATGNGGALWEAGRQRYFTINWIQMVATWAAFALFLIELIAL